MSIIREQLPKMPFGFSTTAAEVVAGVRLDGRIAVITGGAAGIGLETARALATSGASVTLAVRRPFEAEATAEKLRESTDNTAIRVTSLDLSDLTSVRRFVAEWEGPLHILVNNAGIMAACRRDIRAMGPGWHSCKCPQPWSNPDGTRWRRRILLRGLQRGAGRR